MSAKSHTGSQRSAAGTPGAKNEIAHLDALAAHLDVTHIDALLSAFGSVHWPVRRRAAELAVHLGEQAVAHLKARFADLNVDQAHWAMWTVAHVEGAGALAWLADLYREGDFEARSSALSAVAEIQGDDAVKFLIKGLRDESWLNRYVAAEALEARGQAILEHLKRGLAEGVGDIKYWSLELLVRIFGKGAATVLRNLRTADDPNIRHYAIRALTESDEDWAIRLLVEYLADTHWTNRQAASRMLVGKGKRSVAPLLTALDDAAPDTAYWTLRTLSALGDDRMVRPAVALAFGAEGERAGEIREWVVDALAELKTESAIRRLLDLGLDLPDLRMRISDHLVKAGIDAVRPLLSSTLSPNPEVRALAAGCISRSPLTGLPPLAKELEKHKRAEVSALMRGLAAIPNTQLEELLSSPKPDVAHILDLAYRTQPGEVSSIQRISVAELVAPAETGAGAQGAPGALGAQASTIPRMDARGSAIGGVARTLVGASDGASLDTSSASGYGATLDSILIKAINAGASDLHLKAGLPPIFRIRGVLNQTDLPPLTAKGTREMVGKVLTESQLKTFTVEKELDVSYEIPGTSRFRVNVFHDLGGPAMVCRAIPAHVPSLSDLGLPRVFKPLCNTAHGLILICGPTGVGKSTTLAAMIDYINETREEHIVTIEDPVEFRHSPKRCLITNRELGSSTLSFANALRSALREDPDVILVGELRDLATISLALIAAETGHLVLSTLHTGSAGEAVERMVNVFPGEQQVNARMTVAQVLRAIVCQLLVPGIDGKQQPVFEVMLNNVAVANLIRERKMNQLDQAIIAGRRDGMQSRDDHLVDLVTASRIAPQTALDNAFDRQEVETKLKKIRG